MSLSTTNHQPVNSFQFVNNFQHVNRPIDRHRPVLSHRPVRSHRPVDSPQPDNDHQLVNSYQSIAMASNIGYRVVNGAPPDPEKVDVVRTAVLIIDMQSFRHNSSLLRGCKGLGWGDMCDELFEEGLNLSGDPYIRSLLSKPYNKSKVLMRQVVMRTQNFRQTPIYWKGKNHIFIYRSLDVSINILSGFLKLIDESPLTLLVEDIKTPSYMDILQPGQAAVMKGGVIFQFPESGGSGLGLLKCISTI